MREVGNSLLDDMINFREYMAFVGAFFVMVGDDFRDTERLCVERCLWDEAVGERNA